MIRHIVCFRFRPGVDWDDPRATRAESVSRGHPQHIPEILAWSAGRNTTPRESAYDFAVLGLFADRDALERYQVHPDHQRGVAAWRELSTWVAVDLDQTSGALLEPLAGLPVTRSDQPTSSSRI